MKVRYRPVARSFFARPVLDVARDLIGAVLVRDAPEGRCAGFIVEAEAYGHGDPGSHAFRGPTPRNDVMFGDPGYAYVYFTYGMHWCLNAVTDRAGLPGAVLLRAVEPLEGIELMRTRREVRPLRARLQDRDLTRGPARVTQAFAVDGSLNRTDLTKPPLWIATGERYPDENVATGPRIGLGGTQDGRPWRFWLRGNRYVSATRRG